VAAVMLYDKDAAQQETVQRSDEDRKKNRMVVQIKLQCPQPDIEAIAVEQLYHRLAGIRALVLLELLVPVFEICEYLFRVERICHLLLKLKCEYTQ